MGIDGADMAPTESAPALVYSFPDAGQSGFSWGDLTETGGAYGWNLSAEDLAVFHDRIDGGDAILEPETIQLMRDEFLGFNDPDNWGPMGEGWFGTYYGHGGDFGNSSREVHTAAYTVAMIGSRLASSPRTSTSISRSTADRPMTLSMSILYYLTKCPLASMEMEAPMTPP